MNFIKRSLLSLWKHRVRAILLIIAFGVIGTMLFSGLSINAAASAVQSQALRRINSKVLIKVVGPSPMPAATRARLEALPYISNRNYLMREMGNGINFKTIYNLDIYERSEQDTRKEYPTIDLMNEVSITNVDDASLLDEFATGTYRLVEGRFINKADKGKKVADIEQNLVNKNHLHINDTITIKNLYNSKIQDSFKIVGIYQATPPTELQSGYVGLDPRDNIYVPFNSHYIFSINANKPMDYNIAGFFYYYLDDPDHIGSFIAGAKKILDPNDYQIMTESDLYRRVTAPIRGANLLTTLMVGILLVAGCLILALIVALSLRGRRREFGILLAVGERKWKILLQVFVETLVPVFIAFCLAVFASGLVSQMMTDKIVEKGTAVVQRQDAANVQSVSDMLDEAKNKTIGFFNTDNSLLMNKLTVAVTPEDVGKFAGCGLLIVLVSVLVPVVSVIRLSPMAVLTKKE